MVIKRAKAPFGYMAGDPPTPRVVNPGMLLDDSDPAVLAYPDNFEDVETYVTERNKTRTRNVEAATADPGSKRTRTQPEQPPKRTGRTTKKDEPTEEEQAANLGLVDPDANH